VLIFISLYPQNLQTGLQSVTNAWNARNFFVVDLRVVCMGRAEGVLKPRALPKSANKANCLSILMILVLRESRKFWVC
jgi:hypothetical protein